MKILHVIPSYEPAWAFGGTVSATSELCRGLTRHGIDITVYTTDANGKGKHLSVLLNEQVDLGGVKVFYFHCNFGASKAFYSKDLTKRLRQTIKEFDLIHVSAVWQWIQVDVYKICKDAGKPYIVSTHGSLMDWGLREKRWKRLPYWYLFSRWTIKGASAIHFVSEDERIQSLRNMGCSLPSFVIPNPIDFNKYTVSNDDIQNYRNSLRISDEVFVISSLSLIRPRKGLHLLVESLDYLKENNIHLLIGGPVGDERYCRKIKEIIEAKGLSRKITWLGFIKYEELSAFYGLSDLFVLPSFEEAFGMVAIESMAYGTPVLVSRKVPIWREVISDNAGEIIELNPESIAKGIEKCIIDRILLERYARNARQSIERRYDTDKVASCMIKAYEDVLTGRRSPELQWK
jgi:glycosyltransferase involved in cell wall biosynthesis